MFDRAGWQRFLGLSLIVLLLAGAGGVNAASPAGYSQFYVPGDEDNLWHIMRTLSPYQNVDPHMHSIISIVASSDNTVVYYDHWENGYSFNPNNPGTSADETFTLISKGQVETLVSSAIAIPRDSSVAPYPYDGRDMIFVAGGVPTVTRTSWVENVGPVQALSWEVYPVRPQLTTYKVPFGEDLANPSGKNYQDFERVFALIQATEDNTTVTIDLNNDGISDPIDFNHDGIADGTSFTLNRGEVYRFDNSSVILQGDTSYYDFESGADGFTTTTIEGTNWELDTPENYSDDPDNNIFGGGPNECSSGSRCWGTNLDGPYANNTETYLYSPVYNFSSSNSVRITYQEWLEVERSRYDHAILQFSINGGQFQEDWANDDNDRTDNAWSEITHDATSYAAGQASVQWRWMLETDYTWQWGGWYIDEVEVTAGSGGMLTGAMIKASETIQVQYVIGDQGANYELRGLSAFPRGFWDDEYYAPVDGAASTSAPVDIYIHNPHATDLIINWETQSSSGTYTITPGETLSFNDGSGAYVPGGSAVYLKGNNVFWGVSTIDAEDQVNDWGYSLVPALLLEHQHFMGWAPGSTTPGSAPDQSGIFVTAVQDNTQVYVDFQPEQTTDALQTFTLDRLESHYIFDAVDGIMTGAHIWATGPIVMAYGQNPDFAAAAAPAIDVGYTTIPGANMIDRVLTLEKTATPGIVPVDSGSETTFTLLVSSYDYAIDAITVTDTLPEGWQYVADSTTIILADHTEIIGTPANPDINGAQLTWWDETTLGNLASNQNITISFKAKTTRNFSLGDVSMNYAEANGSRTVGSITQTFTASDFAFVTFGNLQVTKTTSGVDPLSPGEQYSYTVTVTNPGSETETLTGITIYDPLPQGVEYVAGSGLVSGYQAAIVNLAWDNFSGSYGGGTNFSSDWIEIDSTSSNVSNPTYPQSPNSGFVQIVGGELQLKRGGSNSGTAEISRQINLQNITGDVTFSFDYRTSGNLESSDEAEVSISASGDPGTFTVLEPLFTGDSSGSRSFTVPTAFKTADFTIRFRIAAYYGGSTEYFYVDNVEISIDGTVPVTAQPSNPPGFISSSAGYVLPPGQSMTLTFQAKVDQPPATGINTIINTAYISADQFPQPISASATNIVNNTITDSASVAGRVWFDEDGDGVEDVGETGFGNVLVALKDEFGATVATTTTSSSGNYIFTGVEPANGYYVEIDSGLPAGLSQTAPGVQTTGRSNDFNLVAGQILTDIDLGFTAPADAATIGDTVWHDANDNGVQDSGEPGIAGVTVTLHIDVNGDGVLDGGDTLAATTTSGADGSYLFTNIIADGALDYLVDVTVPAGYTIDTGEKTLSAQNVVQGGTYLAYDFGLESTGATFTITEKIFVDSNPNGYDSSDSGIGGVTVDLLDGSGYVIAGTTSDADGNFSFTGVPGNGADYTLRITDTAGSLVSYYGTTVAAQAGELDIVNLEVGYSGSSFGYYLNKALGGTIFRDLNQSKFQDTGEPGIAGVTVVLYRDVDGDGVFEPGGHDGAGIASVTTNGSGGYHFSGLENGTYFVHVDNTQAQLAGLTLSTTDEFPSAGHQLSHPMSGETFNDLDFGYYANENLSISGYVWDDNATKDGTYQMLTESGIAGVTVDLYRVESGGATSLIATTTSAADGLYSFGSLMSGTYRVVIGDRNNVLAGNDYKTVFEMTEGFRHPPYNGFEEVSISTGNNATNINFGYLIADPTYALIVSMYGFEKNGLNVVEWQTSSEIGSLGFDLLRQTETGEYQKINAALIPSTLNTIRGVYQCVDAQMQQEGENTYMLHEHELNGKIGKYGPFTVVPGDAPPVSQAETGDLHKLGFTSAVNGTETRETREEALPRSVTGMLDSTETVADTIAMPDLSGPISVKVTIRQAGVYKITIAELAQVTTFAEESVRDLIVAGKMTMVNKGEEVHYVTDADVATLYFYGEHHSSIYSDENVYVLTFNAAPSLGDMNLDGVVSVRDAIFSLQVLAGNEVAELNADFKSGADVNGNKRLDMAEVLHILNGLESGDANLMASVSGGSPAEIVADPTFFTKNLRFENDILEALALSISAEQDYWLWSQFSAIHSSEVFPLEVNDNFDGSDLATLTVHLYGLSAANGAELVLNAGTGKEMNLGTVAWSGTKRKKYQATLQNSDLYDGENTLTVTRADTGGDNIFALDSISVQYLRQYDALAGMLECNAAGNDFVTITNFTGPTIGVLDISAAKNPLVVVDTLVTENSGVYSVTFATGGEKNEYIAFTFDSALEPVEMTLESSSSLKQSTGARYVIVTTRKFAAVSRLLADYRAENGLSSTIVLLSDIFNEFSHGIYDPRAIRDFVAYAAQNWATPPEYIVIVGDGTYDYKNNKGFGGNYVPALMSNTPDGIFPADNLYTDIDGDGMPDIPVGRITARDVGELAVVIDKIISYEAMSSSTEVLFLADKDEDATGNDFSVVSDGLAALLGSAYQKTKIYISADPAPEQPFYTPAAGSTALLDAINGGPKFLNFIGHGGYQTLGKDGIFESSDLAALTNQGYPIFTALTCLVGNYSSPYLESLGESMIREIGGGFVAAWSPSGLSDNIEAVKINEAFIEAVFVDREERLGDAILKALNEYRGPGHLPYMINIFNLLGDPALKLH
jgi:uncharacterized repeat protein (TIGR01451 family)